MDTVRKRSFMVLGSVCNVAMGSGWRFCVIKGSGPRAYAEPPDKQPDVLLVTQDSATFQFTCRQTNQLSPPKRAAHHGCVRRCNCPSRWFSRLCPRHQHRARSKIKPRTSVACSSVPGKYHIDHEKSPPGHKLRAKLCTQTKLKLPLDRQVCPPLQLLVCLGEQVWSADGTGTQHVGEERSMDRLRD